MAARFERRSLGPRGGFRVVVFCCCADLCDRCINFLLRPHIRVPYGTVAVHRRLRGACVLCNKPSRWVHALVLVWFTIRQRPRAEPEAIVLLGGHVATPALSVDTTLRVAELAQHVPHGGDLDAVLRRVAGPALAVAAPTVALLSLRRRGRHARGSWVVGLATGRWVWWRCEGHLAVWALPAAWPASL